MYRETSRCRSGAWELELDVSLLTRRKLGPARRLAVLGQPIDSVFDAGTLRQAPGRERRQGGLGPQGTFLVLPGSERTWTVAQYLPRDPKASALRTSRLSSSASCSGLCTALLLELKGVSQSLRSSYCNFATVAVSRTMVAQGVRPLPFEDGLDAESFVTSILQITQKELLPEQALLLFVWPPGLLLAKFATLSRGSGN